MSSSENYIKERLNEEFEEVNIDDEDNLQEFKEKFPNVNTVPVISNGTNYWVGLWNEQNVVEFIRNDVYQEESHND